MALSQRQKKFVKKNRHKLSISTMSAKLGVAESIISAELPDKKSDKNSTQINKSYAGLEKNLQNFSWNSWLTLNWKMLLALVALVLLVYANGLSAEFVSDDRPTFINNPAIESFSGIFINPQGAFHQFINISVYSLVGPTPIYFRLVNLLAHIGTVICIYLLAGLFGNRKTAMMTALVFAVHPLLVESVTWISGGRHALSGLLILASLIFYLLHKQASKNLFISLVLYLLALLTSEKVVIFPLILVVLELCRGTLRRSAWKKIFWFGLFAAAFVLFYSSLISARVTSVMGAAPTADADTYFNPLLQVPLAITSYLRLFVWPVGLSLYHDTQAISATAMAIIWMVFAVLIGLYSWSFRKNKMLFFWASFFWLSLAPTLTPMKIAWVVAERYVYIGAVGLSIILVHFVVKYFGKWQRFPLDWLIICLFVSVLSTLTMARNIDWLNEDNLWIATVKTAPRYPNAHNNMGDVYSRRGDFKNAIAEFTFATQLNPQYADAYHNLASAYYQLGDTENALENYKKALQNNPSLWQSHQSIAMLYFSRKEYDLAAQSLQRAVAIYPNNVLLHLQLALVYQEMGQLEQAASALVQVLKLEPNNTIAQQELAAIAAQISSDTEENKERN